MNGAQETILHAKVSQEMTVNQLYDKMDDKEWHAEVFKWHGVRSNEMTSGMTMREIADTLNRRDQRKFLLHGTKLGVLRP